MTQSTPTPAPGPDTIAHPAPEPDTAVNPAAEPATRAAPAPPGRGGVVALLVAVAVGTLVSVGLGVYGRLHEPALFAINIAGFSNASAAKSWPATGAVVLALVQLVSAMIMYGRIPRITAPSWIGGLHRWSGRIAVLLTVPVAVHCLYAFGFQDGTPRVLAHSLLGCFFYGAFVAKMLVLNRPGSPKWSLPVLGGLLFSALAALWLTSALWFFTSSGLSF